MNQMGLQKTYFSYFLWPHIAILYSQKECNKQKSGSRSLKYYLLLLLLGAIISGGAIAVGAILIFTLMLRLLAAYKSVMTSIIRTTYWICLHRLGV